MGIAPEVVSLRRKGHEAHNPWTGINSYTDTTGSLNNSKRSLVDASLSFRKDTAVVDFDCRSLQTRSLAAIVFMSLWAPLMFIFDVLIFKIGAVLVLLLVPFSLVEMHRIRPQLKGRWEINRKSRKAKRITSGGNREEKGVGVFETVQVVHINPPGRGNRHLHFVLLKCSEGTIQISGFFSKERATQIGRSLSDWLGIHFSDIGYSNLLAFNTQELLFSRPSAWSS